MVGIPRLNATQQVHFLRKTVDKSATSAAKLVVGTIPAGSVILKPISGVAVAEAFQNDTTSSTVFDIGINDGATNVADHFGTDLAVDTLGAFVPIDEAVSPVVLNDSDITVTPTTTGTASPTGSTEVVIAYIPDTDG